MTVNTKNGKLTVQLYENALSGNKNEYTGKILLRGFIKLEELADMVCKTDASVTREQLESGYNRMNEAALACVADGFSVRLGSCSARPVINGVFAGENAKLNSEQNYVSVCFTASPRSRQVMKSAVVEVLGVAQTGCIINRVLDVRTGEENGALTPDRNLKIFGSRIAVEGSGEDIGVWFINCDDETKKVKVEYADMVDNTASLVTVVIPLLESGEWYVQITTQSGSKKGVLLKEARTCRFDIPLTVI